MSDGVLAKGEDCFSSAMSAIIVRVLPSPMGSATIPPQNCGGSSLWEVCEMLFTKLFRVDTCVSV